MLFYFFTVFLDFLSARKSVKIFVRIQPNALLCHEREYDEGNDLDDVMGSGVTTYVRRAYVASATATASVFKQDPVGSM